MHPAAARPKPTPADRGRVVGVQGCVTNVRALPPSSVLGAQAVGNVATHNIEETEMAAAPVWRHAAAPHQLLPPSPPTPPAPAPIPRRSWSGFRTVSPPVSGVRPLCSCLSLAWCWCWCWVLWQQQGGCAGKHSTVTIMYHTGTW